MSKEALLALAERVEQAQAEQQRAVLEDAVRALSDARLISAACAVRCAILLGVHAFLDAAAALVPEGWEWRIALQCGEDEWFGRAIVRKPSDPRDDEAPSVYATAAALALALTAAALRARAAMEG